MLRGILLLLCVLSTAVLAAVPSDILLMGDQIEFDQKASGVIASGNVKISYKNYDAFTQKGYYYSNQERVTFPHELKIVGHNQEINLTQFQYTLNKRHGQAGSLSAKIERLHIKGKRITFSPEKITIHNAYFTTCDKESETHYWVKARKIYLYPQWGFFVALFNSVNMDILPFPIPVPTYVYGARQYSIIGSSTLVPDIGTNQTEGFYVKQKVGYFVNSHSTGAVEFGTTEKLGLIYGFSHAYSFNNRHHLSGRLLQAGSDMLTGHLLYQHDLILPQKDEKSTDLISQFISNFSPETEQVPGRLNILYQHREIVNDYRVSYRPRVQYIIQNQPILRKDLKLSLQTSLADIVEDQRIRTIYRQRGRINPMLTHYYPLDHLWDLETELNFLGNWYERQETWQRLFMTWRFNYKWEVLNPEFSFTKRVIPVAGESPFLHESRYAIQNDELGFKAHHIIKRTRISTEMHYDLAQQDFRTLDLRTDFTLHCWQLNLTWQTKQSGFKFGVSLY